MPLVDIAHPQLDRDMGEHRIKVANFNPLLSQILIQFECARPPFSMPVREGEIVTDEFLDKLKGVWVRLQGTDEKASMEIISKKIEKK